MASSKTPSAAPHLISPLLRVLQTVACTIVALFMWFKLGNHHAAIVIGSVGAILLVVGLTAPRLLAPLDRAVIWLVSWVGIVMTWLTLVPFFWLCVVPGRLVLLALGKDPMRRKWEPTATSYWTAKQQRSGGPQSQF